MLIIILWVLCVLLVVLFIVAVCTEFNDIQSKIKRMRETTDLARWNNEKIRQINNRLDYFLEVRGTNSLSTFSINSVVRMILDELNCEVKYTPEVSKLVRKTKCKIK